MNINKVLTHKEEILWNNSYLEIGGKMVFYKACISKGILRIKDILNAHDNFLSFQDLKDTFLDYGGLLAVILKDWKNAILHGNQEHTDKRTVIQLTTENVSAKYAQLMSRPCQGKFQRVTWPKK